MQFSIDAPIFLIGYRATGKTTVAQLLAARLGREWIDADDEIERRAGKSIAAVFADDGEEAFRRLEATVVGELCARRRIVVALGGGAVVRDATRRAVVAAGPVIWLTATAATIEARLAQDQSTASRRPDLTSSGGRAEIEALLAERTPIYQACAKLAINTEGKSPADVADQIAAQL